MKNKSASIAFLLFCLVFNLNAQVGIGTTSPNESAVLDIQSENAGILLPRIHINDLFKKEPIKNDSIPEGLLVYNTNSKTGKGFCFWNGEEWEFINPAKEKKKLPTTTHNYVSVADAELWLGNGIQIENDGSVNVGQKINNLIDSISVNNRENKTLFFPQGTYKIETPIILNENLGILGENLRTTFFITAENFEGNAMIQNFSGNGDPQDYDTTSYYNNIENITLRNYYNNPNLVMLWLIHQWESSYIKNIHLYNGSLPNSSTDAVVRGGLWHTTNKANQGKGGQFVVENINVFYGDGVCKEENVKLINAGGLYCRDWNINNFDFPTSPTSPVVHLETSTLILNASNIHIEKTPGNGQASIKLKGSPYAALKLANSDIDATKHLGTVGGTSPQNRIGIEIDLTGQGSEFTTWDIENVSLRNGTGLGTIWDTYYEIPIRIKRNSGNEDIINNNVYEKISGIRKFTKTIKAFNNMPAYSFKDAVSIGEGIIHQQTIGNLNEGESVKINTPHMMRTKFKKEITDNHLFTGGYEAKGYLILISALNNSGNTVGGLFYVLESHAGGSTIQSNNYIINAITSTAGIHLYVNEADKDLRLSNTGNTSNGLRNLTRLNVLIIGTGTND